MNKHFSQGNSVLLGTICMDSSPLTEAFFILDESKHASASSTKDEETKFSKAAI